MASRLLDELVASSGNLIAIRSSTLTCLTRAASPGIRAELEGYDFATLLHAYVNWVDGTIAPRPREVVTWEGFWDTGTARKHEQGIAKIAALARRGEDLAPYLSHRPHPHRDRALNAYDAHHLHFVPKVRGRRSHGSNALLYVRVRRQRMHLLMCGDHSSFNDGTLRQAVADFEVASGNHLRGIVGVTPERTAIEGEDLLRRGINTATASGDYWTFPNLLSSGGTSLFTRQHVDHMVEAIEEWEPRTRSAQGRKALSNMLGVGDDEAAYGWALDYADLRLVETKSRRAVLSINWRR